MGALPSRENTPFDGSSRVDDSVALNSKENKESEPSRNLAVSPLSKLTFKKKTARGEVQIPITRQTKVCFQATLNIETISEKVSNVDVKNPRRLLYSPEAIASLHSFLKWIFI